MTARANVPTFTVTGTVDDALSTVTVNGAPAAVDPATKTFSAPGIILTLGPNTITATAVDALGNSASTSCVVYLDLPAAKKVPRGAITVQGTVDDSAAQVSVNSVSATVSAGTFTASVSLVTGLNTLTATAEDRAGNVRTATIRVFALPPKRPPAKPTVGTVGDPIPEVTTANTITLGGTKTKGTSIWINGQQVAGLSDALTWTATLTLAEGDNELIVVAKDASGAASAETRVTVIVDNLPPVVTFQPPAKTNFNPFPAAGSVDDSQTTVSINGKSAARTKRAFEVFVPLTLGPNTLHLVATSPNGFVTTKDDPIELGTKPSLTSVQPADGAKLYLSTAVTLKGTAVDAQNDPIEYQILLDTQVLKAWSAQASQVWTPTAAGLGLHTVEVRARDAFGDQDTEQVEVLVIRPPIQHP
jgi:hypothetical protein